MNIFKRFELNYWNIVLLKYTVSYYVVEGKYIHFPIFLLKSNTFAGKRVFLFFFPPEGSEFLNIWEIYIYSIK